MVNIGFIPHEDNSFYCYTIKYTRNMHDGALLCVPPFRLAYIWGRFFRHNSLLYFVVIVQRVWHRASMNWIFHWYVNFVEYFWRIGVRRHGSCYVSDESWYKFASSLCHSFSMGTFHAMLYPVKALNIRCYSSI